MGAWLVLIAPRPSGQVDGADWNWRMILTGLLATRETWASRGPQKSRMQKDGEAPEWSRANSLAQSSDCRI